MRCETLERVTANRAQDGTEKIAASADCAPHHGFQGLIRRHLAGIDDTDLWDEQSAAESTDDSREHENEKFETRGCVSGKEHTIFTVANGALNQPELRRSKPAAHHVHAQQKNHGSDEQTSLRARTVD